jgi:hypothetical protein
MNEEPLELLRNVVLAFIRQACPDEAPYFSIVWESFERQGEAGVVTPDAGKVRALLREVGLAFDGEDVPPLAAPYAIATAACVLAELKERNAAPNLEQVKNAVRASAKAYGAPDDIAADLVARMPDILWSAFAQGEWPAPKLSNACEQQECPVFVATLESGKLSPIRQMAYADAARLEEEGRFTITVDERLGRVGLPVEQGQNQGVAKNYVAYNTMRPTRRRILWLALKHAGGSFEHRDILKFKPHMRTNDPGWIHQHPVELGKLIGDNLKAVILKRGSNHAYEVSLKGWSFCWIRDHKNPDHSLLKPPVEV